MTTRMPPETPSEDRRPALQPPQFSLGTLLLGTGVLCASLAAWQALIGILAPAAVGRATLAAIVFGLAVFAHIAGGVLGTRLRQNGDTPINDVPTGMLPAGEHVPISECAPVTKLSHRARLSWFLAIPVVLGATGGAAVGVWLLVLIYSHDVPLANLIFGGGSCFVLGGFLGFGVSSLLAVLGGAIHQAHREGRGSPRQSTDRATSGAESQA